MAEKGTTWRWNREAKKWVTARKERPFRWLTGVQCWKPFSEDERARLRGLASVQPASGEDWGEAALLYMPIMLHQLKRLLAANPSNRAYRDDLFAAGLEELIASVRRSPEPQRRRPGAAQRDLSIEAKVARNCRSVMLAWLERERRELVLQRKVGTDGDGAQLEQAHMHWAAKHGAVSQSRGGHYYFRPLPEGWSIGVAVKECLTTASPTYDDSLHQAGMMLVSYGMPKGTEKGASAEPWEYDARMRVVGPPFAACCVQCFCLAERLRHHAQAVRRWGATFDGLGERRAAARGPDDEDDEDGRP